MFDIYTHVIRKWLNQINSVETIYTVNIYIKT